MAVPSALHTFAVNLLVGGGFVAVGGHIYRQYTGAGVRSLSAFAVAWGLTVMSDSLRNIITLQYVGTPAAEPLSQPLPQTIESLLLLIGGLSELTFGLAPLFWGMFVLRYTSKLDRGEKIALSVLFGFVVLFSIPHSVAHTAVWEPSGLSRSLLGLGTTFVVLALAGSVIGGTARLYIVSSRFPPLTGKETAGLVGAVLLPVSLWFASSRYSHEQAVALALFVVNLVGLSCLWITVTRYRIFDQLPAARAIGRKAAIRSLETAVVILDEDGYITDLNTAAEDLFDVDATDVLGAVLGEILPAGIEADALLTQGRTTVQIPERDRVLEVETTNATDEQGRELGRTVVFYDITQERRRQQRIQVLNRVLRHNLRNELNVVDGYVQLLTDGGAGTTNYADHIDSQVSELVELGDTAREIEEILAADRQGEGPIPLNEMIEETTGLVAADTDASITINVPEDATVHANPTILQPILRELVENAIEHNEADPPEVNVMASDSGTQISVRDNGPGIPEHEIAVFESGQETPLEHGSGLGLWLVRWGVDRLGGEVSFDTDAGGTRVTVTLPTDLVRTPSA